MSTQNNANKFQTKHKSQVHKHNITPNQIHTTTHNKPKPIPKQNLINSYQNLFIPNQTQIIKSNTQTTPQAKFKPTKQTTINQTES